MKHDQQHERDVVSCILQPNGLGTLYLLRGSYLTSLSRVISEEFKVNKLQWWLLALHFVVRTANWQMKIHRVGKTNQRNESVQLHSAHRFLIASGSSPLMATDNPR